jgi:hypothetical protein
MSAVVRGMVHAPRYLLANSKDSFNIGGGIVKHDNLQVHNICDCGPRNEQIAKFLEKK